MKLDRTQDELLEELWANHRDLGDILTILAAMLCCEEISGTEEGVRRCFALLGERVRQYAGDIQSIAGVLIQKAV